MQRSFLHDGSDNPSTHATQQKESETKKEPDCSIEALPDYMRELADKITLDEDKSTDMTTMVADIKFP